MALPIQGGLGAASQALQPKPPAPAAIDAGQRQAENLESIGASTSIKDTVMSDLGDQREALNKALLQMRQSLDARKNRLFDPVLMQAAAGFLKPTKTGSFGESLGSAAENVGIASEREMAREAENQKLEMELVSKEQELRQQLGSDQLVRQLSGGMNPAGQQVASMGAPGAAPTMGQPGAQPGGQNPQQVLAQASQGRIKITDEVLLLANRIAPKLLPTLQEMRKSQTEEEKIRLEQAKLDENTRMVVPAGQTTARPMNKAEFAEYEKEVNKYYETDDLDKIMAFYRRKGYLEPDQFRARATQAGVSGAGKTPLAQSSSEQAGEKSGAEARASSQEKENQTVVQQIYASGRASNTTAQAADAILRLSTNPATKGAFGVLQNANLQSAILGAVAEGVQTPNGSFKFSGIEDAVRKIGGTDAEVNAALLASRYYAQLELQYARMYLQGQGAVSNNERVIVGRIGGSLSDTPLVAAAKAETVKARADFDKRNADLLSDWEKQNPKGYVKDYERSPQYAKLQSQFNDYMGKLNDKYFPGSTSAAPTGNAPQNAPAAPSASDLYQRLKREREKGKS
jgi:hypothetical protein